MRSLAEVICRQPPSPSKLVVSPLFFPCFGLPRFSFPRFSSPLGWPRRAGLAWSPRLMASPVLSHLGGLNWLTSLGRSRLSCLVCSASPGRSCLVSLACKWRVCLFSPAGIACGPVICFCIASPFLPSYFLFLLRILYKTHNTKIGTPKAIFCDFTSILQSVFPPTRIMAT